MCVCVCVTELGVYSGVYLTLEGLKGESCEGVMQYVHLEGREG